MLTHSSSFHRSHKEGPIHSQRLLNQHSPTSSVTSVGSLSRTQASVLSAMLSGSQSSYLHQQSQNQGELLHSIGPRCSQGPSSQQTSEPVISAPIHLPRVHGFPHDHYGSTSRAHLHHHHQQYQQQLQPQQFQRPLPQQSQMQFPAEHFPRPQGEPIPMMMHAHQLVDMLTEENRILRQEMDVCREKVTKLHKVNPFTKRIQIELLLGVKSGYFWSCTLVHSHKFI